MFYTALNWRKETVQVKLAGSTEKKTELYVTMAATRVAEMTWMAGNNKTQNIEAAALRLDNYYSQIGKLAMTGNNAAVYLGNSDMTCREPLLIANLVAQ